MDSVCFKRLEYTSSFDGTGPLKGGVCFDRKKNKKPLLVLMHGYRGNWRDIDSEMERLARLGLFTVGAGMRGRADSAGIMDSGGIEIHDIYDCVKTCSEEFEGFIDKTNMNIWGYSGGGGNVFSCVTKFPDMFRQAASFFGISDYARFLEFAPNLSHKIQDSIGGRPEDVPHRYAARRSIDGAVNNPFTRIHLFWDREEKTCPGWFNLEYSREADSHGYKNVILHESLPGDSHRWFHKYPRQNRNLQWAENNILIPEIFSCAINIPQLRSEGTVKVLGYLVTKEFRIQLGDGQTGTCSLEYSFSHNSKTVRLSNADPKHVKAKLWLNLLGMKQPSETTIDGRLVQTTGRKQTSRTLMDLDPESEISVTSV